MNALDLANLLYLLIQTGQLYPNAMVLFINDSNPSYVISENKMLIQIYK